MHAVHIPLDPHQIGPGKNRGVTRLLASKADAKFARVGNLETIRQNPRNHLRYR